MNRRLIEWLAARPMKAGAFATAGLAATALLAHAAGVFPGFPIIGQGSYCQSTVGSSGVATGVPGGGGGGTTGQGAPAGSPCAQTVPAGPAQATGNELILADTGLPNGQVPQSVSMPSGMLFGAYYVNALVGGDMGTNLWQRGTTPLSAATPTSATMGADGWYFIETAGPYSTLTVSKQTAAADQPPNSAASARVQRVNAQTGTGQICTGQLVPDSDASVFPGKTAIFSVDMLSGALFSPAGAFVNMVIAYHSAADVTTAAANGQGTNTATFASSAAGTQNIANYTEAVNTQTAISTTWTRYSVAAAIPLNIPGTATPVAGIGVKLCFTPVGTAGATDYFEFGKAQLEARLGTSIGPAPFQRLSLNTDWNRQLARYFQLTEGGSGTPIYATGYIPATSIADVMVQFPEFMRITPVVSPITTGGFKFLVAGTATASQNNLTTMGTNSVTQRTAGISGQPTGATAGQGTMLTGNSGTGVIGFSAEP